MSRFGFNLVHPLRDEAGLVVLIVKADAAIGALPVLYSAHLGPDQAITSLRVETEEPGPDWAPIAAGAFDCVVPACGNTGRWSQPRLSGGMWVVCDEHRP